VLRGRGSPEAHVPIKLWYC